MSKCVNERWFTSMVVDMEHKKVTTDSDRNRSENASMIVCRARRTLLRYQC